MSIVNYFRGNLSIFSTFGISEVSHFDRKPFHATFVSLLRNRLNANADINSGYPAHTGGIPAHTGSECCCHRIYQFTWEFLKPAV